ncbi:MAG: CDP-alcohol phosphatidyltransferase family protein [Acidobacteriota bacterium]
MLSPNQITLIRLGLAFVSLGLFGLGSYASPLALVLLVVTLALDAADGMVARRWRLASDAGAAFDIAVDRIVESVYWIFFASAGLISFWLPTIVIARGCLTDFLRAIAYKQGQTAFGEKTMMQSRWGQLLASSRASRAAYGIIKCAAFFAMGAHLALAEFPQWRAVLGDAMVRGLYFTSVALALASVAFCLLRGIPVIIEGRRFFGKNYVLPKLS